VKVFQVLKDQQELLADLHGHEGPVRRVSWAHPRFGALLASCGFDHRVMIWKQTDAGWERIYRSPANLFSASVNALQFAPQELGLMLAAGDSSGKVVVLTHQVDGSTGAAQWVPQTIEKAHTMGVFGLSWAPAVPAGSLVDGNAPEGRVRRFATGGCDNAVKVWTQAAEGGDWDCQTLDGAAHKDWVRDVAWCPNMGLPSNMVASCSQDGTVAVWEEKAPGQWGHTVLRMNNQDNFGCPTWSVSWSVTGTILSVTDDERRVTLWTQGTDRVWEMFASQDA